MSGLFRRIKMEKHYKFIIDTTQYSGNFERELSGWLTGVDDEYANATKLCQKMKEIAPQEVLDWIGWKSRTHKKHDHWPDNKVFLFENWDDDDSGYSRINSIEVTPGWISNGTEFLDTPENREKYPPGKYGYWGAYKSVAIHFAKLPPKYVLDFMKKQAHDFQYNGVLQRSLTRHTDIVTGFRLIEEVVTTDTIELEV